MDSRKALNEIKENTFYNHGRFEMRISKECYESITEVFGNLAKKEDKVDEIIKQLRDWRENE